jgi:prepilin-type N-terminal cleavage/methylation domain-containing protein
MKTIEKKRGFTMIEVLMSLVILAMLMVAVAVAFDASIVNFQANESISKNMNAARAALLRMTTQIRTALSVENSGENSPQCNLVDSDSNPISYWHDTTDADHPVLRLNTDGVPDNDDPILCRNVTAATFSCGIGGSPAVVRNVRIILTITDDKGGNPQTLAAAAVVRRNLN